MNNCMTSWQDQHAAHDWFWPQPQEKFLPVQAKQNNISHLNMERAEPTDKQAKQLTIVLVENLQEDLNDSIVSRYM